MSLPTLIKLFKLFTDHQGPKTDDSMGQVAGQANCHRHFGRRSRAQHSGTSWRPSAPSSARDPQKQFLQLGPAHARELLSAATGHDAAPGCPDPLSLAGPVSHGRHPASPQPVAWPKTTGAHFFTVLSFEPFCFCVCTKKKDRCVFLFFEQIKTDRDLLSSSCLNSFKFSSDQFWKSFAAGCSVAFSAKNFSWKCCSSELLWQQLSSRQRWFLKTW